MSAVPGRILALDLGDVRIGVAKSDPLGITAQPVGTFRSRGPGGNVHLVRELVERHDARCVVVGHPLLLSGEAGARARDAESMVSRLRGALEGVSVELWDERLTTAQAERVLRDGGVRRRRRKEVVDALAAVVLLQSYLEAGRTPPPGQEDSETGSST